jgi:prolyl oligopeptidase
MSKVVLSAFLFISYLSGAQSTLSFRSNYADTFYNVAVPDYYRKLEDTGNVEVKAWMKEESDKTKSILKNLPGYNKLYQQLKETIEGAKFEEINRVTRINNTWYAIKRYPTQNNPMLYKYDKSGVEKLAMDPGREYGHLKSKNVFLQGIASSVNGRFIEYYLVVGGNEAEGVSVMVDMKTGRKNIEPGFSGGKKMTIASHNTYDSVLYYWYLPFRHEGDPVHWFDSSLVYKHGIGTDSTKDELIIDFASQKIKRGRSERVQLELPYNSNWAIAVVKNLVSKELRLYATQKQTLSVRSEWKKICDWDDGVSQFVVDRNDIYLMTYKNASNFKIISTKLSTPDLTNAMTVLPQQTFVLSDMTSTKDKLLITALADNGGKLISVPFKTKKVENIKLLESGVVQINYASERFSDFIFSINSWTRTTQTYQYNSVNNKISVSPIQKYKSIGSKELEVKEVKVRSYDGVMVPMTLVYKKRIKPDTSNNWFVGLSAYGAYGMQDNPNFWPDDMLRYNKGYIKAVAHVRGGGIYGEDWHRAGMKGTKPNTWKDVIACAEYLISNKYATRQKLVLSGGSAGGITAGRSITERPDLFRAAVISVGALDMVSFERSPNGFGNTTEFGSAKTKEGFDALYAMSAYQHVKNGVAYPGVLFMHGVNDSRVPVFNSLKMYARMKEASTSSLPLLLNLNFDSGHGAQESTNDLVSRIAESASFSYWMAGYREFQPLPK